MKLIKLFKTITSFLLVIAMIFAVAACKTESTVESIKLKFGGIEIANDELTVNLSVGTITFTADVVIIGTVSKEFTLSSSDTSVATVSEKTVTLIAGGDTVLTAISAADTAKKHSITLNVNDDVTVATFAISATGATADKATAAAGETVTLTPDVPAGKVFDSWTVVPASVVITDNQFTMPAQAVTITANYVDAAAPTFAISVTGATANKTTAAEGATVTLTLNAPAGKVFSSWTVVPASVIITNNQFTMPAQAVTITANYVDAPPSTFAISVTGGTANKTIAAAGETVTLTPTVPALKEFDSWTTVPSSVVITNNQFTMPAQAVTVTANFVNAPPPTVAPSGIVMNSADMENRGVYNIANSGTNEVAVTYTAVQGGSYACVDFDWDEAESSGKDSISFKVYNLGTASVHLRVDLFSINRAELKTKGYRDGEYNPDDGGYNESDKLYYLINNGSLQYGDGYHQDVPAYESATITISTTNVVSKLKDHVKSMQIFIDSSTWGDTVVHSGHVVVTGLEFNGVVPINFEHEDGAYNITGSGTGSVGVTYTTVPGNGYKCIEGDISEAARSEGKNTISFKVTNNGTAAVRIRVDLYSIIGEDFKDKNPREFGDTPDDRMYYFINNNSPQYGDGDHFTIPAGGFYIVTISELSDSVRFMQIFIDSHVWNDEASYSGNITFSDLKFTFVGHNSGTGGGEEPPVDGTKVEAETANLTGATPSYGESCLETVGSASGGQALGNLGAPNNQVVWTFTSEAAGSATLILSLASTGLEFNMEDWSITNIGQTITPEMIEITVNGIKINFTSFDLLGTGTSGFDRWTEINFGTIDLIAGANTITLKVLPVDGTDWAGEPTTVGTCPNIDYLRIVLASGG